MTQNCLSLSEGGGKGGGRVRVEEQPVEGKDPQVEACSHYEGETTSCRSEEGEPWNGRDQILTFQEDVSFLQACTEGVSRIFSRSGHLLHSCCVSVFPVKCLP